MMLLILHIDPVLLARKNFFGIFITPNFFLNNNGRIESKESTDIL
jgi:hypothetical protein